MPSGTFSAVIARLLPALALALLLSGPARAEELDCARCHQNPAMRPSLKNDLGVPRSLYIDPEAFRQSWHYKLGKKTECVSCHENITAYPHQRPGPLRCADCHEDDRKREFRLIEARLGQSVHKNLDCIDCHDAHANKPAEAMTLAEKNRGCLKCHEFGIVQPTAALYPIPLEAFHSWHPQARLHIDRMACVVCHTSLAADAVTAEPDKHLIGPKENATRACAVCHSGQADSKITEYLIDVGPAAKENVPPEEMLKRIYLVGGTRKVWIEIIGGSMLMLSMIGVAGHGLARVYLGRKK